MYIVVAHDDTCPQSARGRARADVLRDEFLNAPGSKLCSPRALRELAAEWDAFEKTQECNCGAAQEIARRAQGVTNGQSSATPRV